jgi:hypothetical protein
MQNLWHGFIADANAIRPSKIHSKHKIGSFVREIGVFSTRAARVKSRQKPSKPVLRRSWQTQGQMARKRAFVTHNSISIKVIFQGECAMFSCNANYLLSWRTSFKLETRSRNPKIRAFPGTPEAY